MFKRTIKASTKRMKDAGEKPVVKEVTFPDSVEEIEKGIGPWATFQEMFEDAVAHRTVIIQSDMRRALESGEESEEDNGKSLPKFRN